ncbi:MAG TPA: hypothetical protein VEY88_20235 [Archangium sp.]|nr:hypothetical protein [Archangium sp.]
MRPPADWRGRHVSTLDILLFMREEIRNGTMPEMFIGAVDIHRLSAFVQGSELTLYYNRVPNDSYQQFLTWLRDVKQEFPQGGRWARKCLEDCGGDHLRAIQRFLELAAEFVSQHK